MDLVALKQYLHLSETLHFAQAARACHVSPSTLSRSLQRLEDELGVPLLERSRRHVRLTRAGRLFQDYARTTLEQWGELQKALHSDRHVLRGELGLFCSVTASYCFLPELLRRFRIEYPEVEIKLRTGDAAESIPRVMAGEADVVIAAMPEKLPATLSFQGIAESPLVFIAPTAACQVRQELDANLAGGLAWSRLPLIVSEQGPVRRKTDRWFRSQGIEPHIYTQVAGSEAIVSMVSLGVGVGVVPELVVMNSPRSAEVSVLAVEPIMEPISIGVCARTNQLSNPLIEAFWSLLG